MCYRTLFQRNTKCFNFKNGVSKVSGDLWEIFKFLKMPSMGKSEIYKKGPLQDSVSPIGAKISIDTIATQFEGCRHGTTGFR